MHSISNGLQMLKQPAGVRTGGGHSTMLLYTRMHGSSIQRVMKRRRTSLTPAAPALAGSATQ